MSTNINTEQGQTKQNVGVFNQQNLTETYKYVLNSDDIENQVEIIMRGLVWDPDHKLHYQSTVKPKLNDEGIAEIRRILKLRLSRIFIMSNLDNQDVKNIARVFAKNCIKELFGFKRKYDIDKMTIRVLFHELFDSMYVTLKKADGANTQKFLTGTVQVHETYTVQGKNAPLLGSIQGSNAPAVR